MGVNMKKNEKINRNQNLTLKESLMSVFKSGETESQSLGLELEHFACDSSGMPAPYETIESFIKEAKRERDSFIYSENHVIGLSSDDYTVTLEPAAQIEISIKPCAEIREIENTYKSFRASWDSIVQKKGFHIIQKGVLPLVESGELKASDLSIIPKKRYHMMNEYFEDTGRFAKNMMRTSMSTQVSIDFSSEKDAMRKLQMIQVLSPIFALLTSNPSCVKQSDMWKPYLIRQQIWKEVDPARCEYIDGSMDSDFSYAYYADYLLSRPCVLSEDAVKDGHRKSVAECYSMSTPNAVETILSMVFPNVRLKNYLEIRMADSMDIKRVLGYLALIKGIFYSEIAMEKIEDLLSPYYNLKSIREADDALIEKGYNAFIYNQKSRILACEIYNIAKESLSESDRHYLKGLIDLPLMEALSRYDIEFDGKLSEHIESAKKANSYMKNSTAYCHGYIVETRYAPRLFTKDELSIFSSSIKTLYEIFDKIIKEYRSNPVYRNLFGFSKELEALILSTPSYSCNIPMARIDIFYDNESRKFKFCEFNTDGSSAMNEEREVSEAFTRTLAYKNLSKSYRLSSFELFDSWIDKLLKIYADFRASSSETFPKTPTVGIVDFLDKGNIHEFEIFKEKFAKRGIVAEICDIREMKYSGGKLISSTGNVIDCVYRRAVTSDIIRDKDNVRDFLLAFNQKAFCMIGEFSTFIIHDKLLFKIIRSTETLVLLSESEKQFVEAHFPLTYSIDELFDSSGNPSALFHKICDEKDRWLIKPTDEYSARGVVEGRNFNDGDWASSIIDAKSKRYVVQEYYENYITENVDLSSCDTEEKDLKWEKWFNFEGLFVYAGEIAGIYSRIKSAETNEANYYNLTLPTLLAEPL